MRIVTNGTHFAVVRRRWIFTQFLDCRGEFDSILHGFHIKYRSIYYMNTIEEAQQRIHEYKKKRKWWDVK